MRIDFDDVTFDSEQRELIRDGETVHLSPKAFILLQTLIERAPAAVSKHDLYQAIWGEMFVEESNLPNLVSEIRNAVGDDRKTARVIKTVHGFGYRFAPPATEERGTAVPSRFLLESAGRSWPLSEGVNLIGRDPSADVRLESAGVSRRHARIIVDGPLAMLEDLDSKNGTFAGDGRISEAVALKPGDTIRLGSASLTLRQTSQGESTITEFAQN